MSVLWCPLISRVRSETHQSGYRDRGCTPRLPEPTEKNRSDITRLQEILRRLPKPLPNVFASYSFSVSKLEPSFRGVNRECCVMLEREGLIEIPSIYVVVPDRDEHREKMMEDRFMFWPGIRQDYHPDAWLKWARQVSDRS